MHDPSESITGPIAQEEGTPPEEDLDAAIRRALSTEGEDARHGWQLVERECKARRLDLSLGGLARLLNLLDAQTALARRRVVATTLLGLTVDAHLQADPARQRGVVVAKLALEALRERDYQVEQALVSALAFVGWRDGDTHDGLDALAFVVTDPQWGGYAQKLAADGLAEAASHGDEASLDVLRGMRDASNGQTASLALDALAAVAGCLPSSEGKALRREVVSALEALPAGALGAQWETMDRLAPTLRSDPSRLRQALLGESLVERWIAVYALWNSSGAIDADEREALFRIAEGAGPSALRERVLPLLLKRTEGDHAARERLASIAGSLSRGTCRGSSDDAALVAQAEDVTRRIGVLPDGDVNRN